MRSIEPGGFSHFLHAHLDSPLTSIYIETVRDTCTWLHAHRLNRNRRHLYRPSSRSEAELQSPQSPFRREAVGTRRRVALGWFPERPDTQRTAR